MDMLPKSSPHTLWRREVNDVSVALEHVDLFNGLDWLHVHLLQRRLELLVIRARALVGLLDLPSWSAFAAIISCEQVFITIMALYSEGRTAECVGKKQNIPCGYSLARQIHRTNIFIK